MSEKVEEEATKKPTISEVPALDDERKKAEEAHAKSIRDILDKDPGLLKDAIIISPSLGDHHILFPTGMSEIEILGSLEAAKFFAAKTRILAAKNLDKLRRAVMENNTLLGAAVKDAIASVKDAIAYVNRAIYKLS